MTHTNHLFIAIGAVAVIAALGLFGLPVGRYAPFALILLVCPVMMFLMMRRMAHGSASGHGGHQGLPASGRRAGRPVTADRP